jgi:hypothetical protein
MLLSVLSATARADVFDLYIPANSENVEGNDVSDLPFGYPSPVRYQQVYNASAFSRVPAGGAFLTGIFLRGDCLPAWSGTVTNVQVKLSTTAKAADQLSPVFAENIGPDETAVFFAATYIPPGHWGLPSCPAPGFFGNPMNLSVLFWYDPTRGNLLLDLRHSGVEWWPANTEPPHWYVGPGDPRCRLDAQTASGDAISRAAAFSLTTNTAAVLDTTGLVTMFVFATVPALTNHFETNTLTLTWDGLPWDAVRLQWSRALGPASAWSDYPGPVGGGARFRIVTIPVNTLQSPTFFRLHWIGLATFAATAAGIPGPTEPRRNQ